MRVFSASILRTALLTIGLWAGAPTMSAAHEGHDHGNEAQASPTTTAPRGSSRTEALELVAIARNGRLAVFLDRVGTNEPVLDATIQAETPEGAATGTPMPDGSYGFDAHWSLHPGEHEVLFTVTASGASDVFPVTLTVPEPPPEPPAAGASAWAAGLAAAHDFQRHLKDADPLPLAIGGIGFLLGSVVTLLMRGRRYLPATALVVLVVALAFAPRAFAREGTGHGDGAAGPQVHQMAVTAPVGQDLARRQPDGSIFVPKPTQRVLSVRTVVTASDILRRTVELPGRIVPDPSASGVVQSSVGGRLSPPESGIFPRLGTRVRKGEVIAYVTPPVQAVDASDMRQRQGELDQQIAITERRAERYRKLAPGGSVSQVQLEDAQAELKGLLDRRAALDNIRQQPEALKAPVDGVIAEASAVAGQMASPGVQVFQIVDPSRLWVEALSFDAVAGGQDATARMADGRMLRLAYMGAGLADRSQAVPMHFAVEGAPPELRTGQFVTVLAETDAQQKGLALPRTSVVRGGNGQSIVYEHTAPERFEPREVRVEPLDASRVLVVSGVAPGKRIVTQGAELLNQVR
ncbi:efflux RND transporter periplasmic adaptor subunit [Methylorubrum extorquens]|jgi:cobalt-zinc-cadmium efflux system membrane fusion protein|uniref:RND efflux transporter, MFP subunit n=2 Tax=Methylorubrum extorquens TaxID=408 RepID=C7CEV3_METED|nr:efflux RND transporter periplasmic adaptor subunit [Methylorubrum extorquens]EHP91188.1 efflux transporter, RND family, MFP subunit [Methylorubrum extorquens DSM 13060]MCG5248739.1 efflux RND transporter periplasmic adaptor subunit [Methylorubrum extorquens]CAX22845.1 RND efflux transporter, MFP subunit [Methylorubrum extorquens DM4]